MCSDCGDAPTCGWCGDTCFGACDDPDSCGTCWLVVNSGGPIFLDTNSDAGSDLEQCEDSDCECKCHNSLYSPFEFAHFDQGESLATAGANFTRKGTFDFMALPPETRNRIYGYACAQDGNGRHSALHRGTIHTNLLLSCRQVYAEAGHLPLTLNTLCLSDPVATLDFLGFMVTRNAKKWITRVHIEVNPLCIGHLSWRLLFKRLGILGISHLRLTFKGSYEKNAILSHQCVKNTLSFVTGLTTLDIQCTNFSFKRADTEELRDEFRKLLVKKTGVRNRQKVIVQKACVRTAGQGTPSDKDTKITDFFEALKGHTSDKLLDQYQKLQDFAHHLDPDASAVKIRLEQARLLAEKGRDKKFKALAKNILETLEKDLVKVNCSHDALVDAME